MLIPTMAHKSAAADLRLRVAQWRIAERRESELRCAEGPTSADAAFEAACELYSLCPAERISEDRVRKREVEAAREAWRRLRLRLGWQLDEGRK